MDTAESSADPRACLVCRASGPRFTFSKNGHRLYRCRTCGFHFVYPMPQDTSSVYGDDYFSGAECGFGYVNYDEDKVAMHSFFTTVLGSIEHFLPNRGALLDVGAATGFFLKLARDRGWKVSGNEVSTYGVKEAQAAGLDVRLGNLAVVGFPASSFDVITMLDVIEHVPDPRALFVEARSLLRPGGVVAINTPDAGSMWAKIFGRRWHAFAPPEHLGYFNRKNLQKLLQDVGFEPVIETKIGKHFTPAYVVSMLGRWIGSSTFLKLAHRLESSRINRLYLPINIRDNMFILARIKPFES